MLGAVEVVPARSCTAEQLTALFESGGWPAFIEADPWAASALPRVREVFADLELSLIDDHHVVAAGWGVPLTWDGTSENLPAGYSESLHRALADHDRGVKPNTFVLCAAQVRPDRGRRGLAAATVAALIEHATDQRMDQVIAPLRPTQKHRYPLTAIEQYAAWLRTDGQPFDPWLRLHHRLGAEVLATTEQSQTFTGTVAQWERWSGLALPASGRYIVPDALAPLEIDLDIDLGTCTEAGIWVRHR